MLTALTLNGCGHAAISTYTHAHSIQIKFVKTAGNGCVVNLIPQTSSIWNYPTASGVSSAEGTADSKQRLRPLPNSDGTEASEEQISLMATYSDTAHARPQSH